MAISPASAEVRPHAARATPRAPSAWRARGLTLRPVEAKDEIFLRALFSSFRAEELAFLAWPEAQKRAFCESQFDLQDRHFRQHFPEADFLVIEQAGRPIGRVYLDRQTDGHLVIDIGFLPAERGQGLGRDLLRHIQAQARREGASRAWLHVAVNNPRALALYEKLGFRRTALDGAHWRMEWPTP